MLRCKRYSFLLFQCASSKIEFSTHRPQIFIHRALSLRRINNKNLKNQQIFNNSSDYRDKTVMSPDVLHDQPRPEQWLMHLLVKKCNTSAKNNAVVRSVHISKTTFFLLYNVIKHGRMRYVVLCLKLTWKIIFTNCHGCHPDTCLTFPAAYWWTLLSTDACGTFSKPILS